MLTSTQLWRRRLTTSPRFWPTYLLAGWVLTLALSATAHAADKERDPEGYRAAIDAAVQEYELNHFAESREHFAQAHALYPNARTLRGLGVADFELRRYVDAVQELSAALAHRAKPLAGAPRQETEALLTRARTYVGELQLALDPPDATVRLDDEPVQLDAEGRFMLEVGDHQLEVSAPDHITQRRSLRVHGQQHQQLRIELAAIEPPPAIAANDVGANAPQPQRAEPRRRRVVTWAFGGLTLAAVGSLVGLVVAVENTKSSLETCLEADGVCEPVAEKGMRLERVRNVMIGVAGAAAIATVVTFFVEGRAHSKARMALRLSPTAAQLVATF